MKHVVPFQSNCNIRLSCVEESGHYLFTYADNGPGLQPHINPQKTNSMGLRLIRRLAGQIGAKIDVVNKQGLEYRFTLNI